MTESGPLPVVDVVIKRLTQLQATHYSTIQQAAETLAGCIIDGGLIHAFGSGHSHMLVEEMFFRAGGLLSFSAILDPALMLHISAVTSGEIEKITEYAKILLDRYTLNSKDAMLVISYSGINPVPVEVALLSKSQRLPVVALTSVEASRNSPARHPSGQRLYEVADIVLDNPGPAGDASLTVPGLDVPVCALSTIMGASILQSLLYEIAQRLNEAGKQPPILRSENVTDSGTSNRSLIADYRRLLRHL